MVETEKDDEENTLEEDEEVELELCTQDELSSREETTIDEVALDPPDQPFQITSNNNKWVRVQLRVTDFISHYNTLPRE